ncbi:MAG: hypothetical protein OXB88_00795, partial [Bacteriovoracales bacterium]|nr:hypothetical protein [Bacteriovoracales bacterium]
YSLEVKLTAKDEGTEVVKTKTVPLRVNVASTPLAARWLEIGVETSDPAFTERGEVEFVEGKEGQFRLVGHLLGGVVADYKIEVLNPPKGAKVTTSSKGGVQFVWSPSQDTVVGETNFTSIYHLEVKLIASDEGREVTKNKTIPLRVNVASTPLAPHLLDIVSSPWPVSLIEGREEKFNILASLHPDVKASTDIRILNLPEGASERAIEGGIEVTWTPPSSTIVGADQLSTSYPLEVELTANQEEGGAFTIKRTIPLGIYVASIPLTEDSLSIRVEPAVPSFTVGVQNTFKVFGKVLGGGTVGSAIRFLNLPEGAQASPIEGGFQVNWTPPTTTLKGDQFMKTYPLKVEMTAQGDEGVVKKMETVSLGIYIKDLPLRSEFLVVETSPTPPRFEEGVEKKVVLSAGLLGGLEMTPRLDLVNPPVGAKVKRLSKGQVELTWTPPASTLTGDEFTGSYSLEVKLSAVDGDGREVTRKETVSLAVYVIAPPLGPEALGFELSSEVGEFVEGREGSLSIFGKMIGGDESIPVRVNILNLPKGAAQDSVEGGVKMRWTPSLTTVTGDNYYTKYNLKAVLTATNGEEEASKEISIPLLIRAETDRAPVIRDVSFAKNPVPETETTTMTISVLDPLALGTPPNLQFSPISKGRANAYRFLSLAERPVQDANNPGLWTYKAEVDFMSLNVVKKGTFEMNFGLMAYSPFGIASDLYEGRFNVLNRVVAPSGVLATEPVPVKYGKDVMMDFVISDPRREGIVTTNFEEACKTYLQKSYKCRCQPVNPSVLSCSLKWFVFKGAPREIRLEYWAKNTNPEDKTDFKTKEFFRDFRISSGQ